MKKFYLFFTCLSMCSVLFFPQNIVETDYYANNPDLGGDVVIKKRTEEAKENITTTSFEVEVSHAGDYYISFWLLPTKLSDGTFATFEVSVNGNPQLAQIKPTKGDWQAIALSNGSTIPLNKGPNTISVIGEAPDVPNVEHIKLSVESKKAQISSIAYDTYKAAIIQESISHATDSAFMG